MDSVLPLPRVFVNTREVALAFFDHSQPAYERLVRLLSYPKCFIFSTFAM